MAGEVAGRVVRSVRDVSIVRNVTCVTAVAKVINARYTTNHRVSAHPTSLTTLTTLTLLTTLTFLPGCANHAKLREEELARIAAWLPGNYDNRAQVDEDLARNAVDLHEPIDFVIVAVSAPIIGEQLYYAQQHDSMNPRRVVDQRLYRFEKSSDDKAIVHMLYRFREPERWVDGHRRADIFKSLVPDDLSATSGCELKWEFDGERFVGQSSRISCRSPPESGPPLAIEMRVELEEGELRLSERWFDAAGTLVRGLREDPLFRFRKVAKP